MATKKLIKGNEAICHGAVAARCDAFFGYPITPQNEIPEKMSELMPANCKVFLQAESELAAINMVLGAASAGKRRDDEFIKPRHQPQDGGDIVYRGVRAPMRGSERPARRPRTRQHAPAQADYFQAVKGGGHGDYRMLTLAPWSAQECYEFMPLAFDLADRYRNPVMVLMDAIIGQMLEPVDLHGNFIIQEYPKPWATNGARGRAHNIINSLWIDVDVMEKLNQRIQAKYTDAAMHVVKCHEYLTNDAELVLVAYGSPARICRTVVDMAREDGMNVGLLRPITLFPFPERHIADLATRGKAVHGRRDERGADGRGRETRGEWSDRGPVPRPHRRRRPHPDRDPEPGPRGIR